jgi:glycosyltransferase involved in cell wall biosynthesis
MRVAVVHDWLTESGGAEKVTRELVDLFDADVFALVDFLAPEDRSDILHGKRATTTFIQRLPFARRKFRWYLPLFPRAIERLDLSGYDLILSSSYAVAKGVRKRPGQKHVCYIHTPMRYAWVDEEGYLRDHNMRSWKAWVLKRVLRSMRKWDLANSSHVDRFIANSRNVAERVRSIYGREADVVLPPVDPEVFTLYTGVRRGYLTVSRLVPYKHTDRIIEAFRDLPSLTLTVVGDGSDAERLRALAGPNIRFTGHLAQADLVRLMQRSSALVCTANEDLGLTVVEAQTCGTPVIALRAGGYLETVDEVHGSAFFDTDAPGAIREAILQHADAGTRRTTGDQRTTDLPAGRLRKSMTPFFRDRFRTRIGALIKETLDHA